MMSLFKHLTLAFLLFAVLTNGALSAEQPNILFILADDVGREVLGSYGGESYATPNLDRLAAGGIRYEHAYVMAMCHPTRICLLTGRYPFRLGNPNWGTFRKSHEAHSMANVLKRAGYATAVSGKWQLTLLKDDLEQPHRMGFDEYCLDAWHEGPWYYQPRIWQNGRLRDDISDRYGPDITCEYLIDFIRRHHDRPFFAYYTMTLCHDETNDLEQPAPYGPLGRYENYAEMVKQMDERVGRVINELESLNLRDRTLVLFLSDNGTQPKSLISADHGEYIYEPFTSRMNGREIEGGKGTLTDWGTRVPMIVNMPSSIDPGQVSDSMVDASDILPTLAAVADASLPSDCILDGHNITGTSGKFTVPRRWVFAEHQGKYFVRNRRWKLYGDGRFFDIDSDVDEKHSIPKSEIPSEAQASYSELAAALQGLGLDSP